MAVPLYVLTSRGDLFSSVTAALQAPPADLPVQVIPQQVSHNPRRLGGGWPPPPDLNHEYLVLDFGSRALAAEFPAFVSRWRQERPWCQYVNVVQGRGYPTDLRAATGGSEILNIKTAVFHWRSDQDLQRHGAWYDILKEPVLAGLAREYWRGLRAQTIRQRRELLEAGLTIGDAIRLVQDPYEGKYPTDTAHRREVLRSLRFAERALGSSRTWTSIRKRDLRALGRRRIDELVKQGKRGARTAEKVLEHVLAVASWLRDNEHIAETACRPSSKWTDELYEDWRTRTGSDQDYQVDKPRHSRDDALAIMAAAPQVDPRFDLLLTLGADLRLGQVVRARRSQLDLVASTFTVYGRRTKKGTTVELTPGQRRAVENALGGYLNLLEASCADYHLFPGRFATSAGEFTKADGGHVHKQTLYRWFRRAEEIAGVTHRPGRCAYGIRRVAVDELLRQRVSLPALQNNGGWTSPAIPTQEYADQESHAARREAAQARAAWRGEGPATPSNPALD